MSRRFELCNSISALNIPRSLPLGQRKTGGWAGSLAGRRRRRVRDAECGTSRCSVCQLIARDAYGTGSQARQERSATLTPRVAGWQDILYKGLCTTSSSYRKAILQKCFCRIKYSKSYKTNSDEEIKSGVMTYDALLQNIPCVQVKSLLKVCLIIFTFNITFPKMR